MKRAPNRSAATAWNPGKRGAIFRVKSSADPGGNDDRTKHLLRSKFNQNWRLVEGKRKVVTVHPLREVSLRLWFAEGNCKH